MMHKGCTHYKQIRSVSAFSPLLHADRACSVRFSLTGNVHTDKRELLCKENYSGIEVNIKYKLKISQTISSKVNFPEDKTVITGMVLCIFLRR